MASKVVSASGAPRGLGVFCEVWKSSFRGLNPQCPTKDARGHSEQIPISYCGIAASAIRELSKLEDQPSESAIGGPGEGVQQQNFFCSEAS